MCEIRATKVLCSMASTMRGACAWLKVGLVTLPDPYQGPAPVLTEAAWEACWSRGDAMLRSVNPTFAEAARHAQNS